MKNMKGFIVLGLLILLIMQMGFIALATYYKLDIDNNTVKEIMIYILGILSGYIANKDIK